MRAAVCGGSPAETDSLCQRLAGLGAARRLRLEPYPVSDVEAFLRDFRPGVCRVVYLALGSPSGFLAARRLRELDRQCGIVLIDSTDQYAIQSYRLHLTDFLVYPVSDRDLERSVERCAGTRDF